MVALVGDYGFGVFQQKWLKYFEANQKLAGLCASVVVGCFFCSLMHLSFPQNMLVLNLSVTGCAGYVLLVSYVI
jgi:hypothetical protein